MQTETELTLGDFTSVLSKRRKLVFIVFAAFITMGGLVVGFIPRLYRGDVTLTLNGAPTELPARDVIMIVGRVSSDKIAVMFPTQARFVRDLTLTALDASADRGGDRLKVEIDARSRESIPPAVEELIAYLNEVPLLRRFRDEREERLTRQIAELANTIEQASTTQLALDRMLREGRVSPVGFNPADLDRRIADFRVEKVILEQTVKRIGRAEIAGRVFVYEATMRPRPVVYMAVAILMGLLVGLLAAVVVEVVDNGRRPSV